MTDDPKNWAVPYIECGSCGHYHRREFYGDCRNDWERFSSSDLEDRYGANWTDLVEEI